jgi:hypothetical protein
MCACTVQRILLVNELEAFGIRRYSFTLQAALAIVAICVLPIAGSTPSFRTFNPN